MEDRNKLILFGAYIQTKVGGWQAHIQYTTPQDDGTSERVLHSESFPLRISEQMAREDILRTESRMPAHKIVVWPLFKSEAAQ